jgi:hypothetical protein
MKSLAEMSKVERSLLLFLETAAVDHGGLLDARHMNGADFDIATAWAKEGFLASFRRVPSSLLDHYRDKGHFNHYVVFSPEAWTLAHQERRARSGRLTPGVLKKMEEARGE